MSETESTVIDDFLVLGNAVPDELSDGRKTVCVAGYSKKQGLIRIYPVPPRAPMKRWNILEVPIERNNADTRSESWKIQFSKADWDKLHQKIRLNGKVSDKDERIAIIENLLEGENGYGCVEEINEKKRSIGLIQPSIIRCYFEDRKKYDDSIQTTLGSDSLFKTIRSYKNQPRIIYRCASCKVKNPHDQQVLEWGIYEWMRQNPAKLDDVWENLHITDDAWAKPFLVGNQARYRNSFIIISILRYKIPVV